MTHYEEGMIVALRDEGPFEAGEDAHLDGCATCVADLAEARSRSTLVAEALATLDLPIDLAAAKAAARARLDRARPPLAVPAWRRWPLGRAAVLVLASAGAVSALTWSPLRTWWAPTPPVAEPAAVAAPTLAPEPATSAVEVDVVSGRIDVLVRGAVAGSVIEVAWTDETTVRVVAPRGSGFTYADGRVQVDVASGTVRVELPRDIPAASIEVDGTVYVERSATGIAVLAPAADVTDDLIRFVIAGP